MGIFRTLIATVVKSEAEVFTFKRLDAKQVPQGAASRPLTAESDYLTVYLKSVYVPFQRLGISTYYGSVMSIASVPHSGIGLAKFQVVTTPSELKGKDVKNLSRVISVNKLLLDSVPYRGGDVSIEVGLFSIKSGDLAQPLLDVVEKMADAAGVMFIKQAMPFIAPLEFAIGLLTGSAGPAILEVGLDEGLNPPATGVFVVMRAPLGAVDISKLAIDPDSWTLLDASGKPFTAFPYMLLEILASPRKHTWFQIPELRQAFADLKKSFHPGPQRNEKVKQALIVFRTLALTSDELLLADAQSVIKAAEDLSAKVLPGGATAAMPTETLMPADLKDLSVQWRQ